MRNSPFGQAIDEVTTQHARWHEYEQRSDWIGLAHRTQAFSERQFQIRKIAANDLALPGGLHVPQYTVGSGLLFSVLKQKREDLTPCIRDRSWPLFHTKGGIPFVARNTWATHFGTAGVQA